MDSYQRLFNPKSIAVIGGGWAANVIAQLQISGYDGDIWPIHPSKSEIGGLSTYANVESLPGPPDAAFIGVNRELTVELVEQLNTKGAGGVICFASGFRETAIQNELIEKPVEDLQDKLVKAAGSMPMLGPNCYGLLNYLDNICLWPDQHGGRVVESGIGIIAQSSNIAINMTMQQRGLSIAQLFALGNQAQTTVSNIMHIMIDDPRITAIGLYLEGFDDIQEFENISLKAAEKNKPIIALKIGKSVKAQIAVMTHTASLAGGSQSSSALLKRLGIVEVESIETFLESLKFLDIVGSLNGPDMHSVSCSGGEASLMSDLTDGSILNFPELTQEQNTNLSNVLGDKVTLANPLDYHTYIWGDIPTMTSCFKAVMQGERDLSIFVLDIPREDICDPSGHECAIQAIIDAKIETNTNVAVMSTLPENINETVAQRFKESGIVPLNGMQQGLVAIESAVKVNRIKPNIAQYKNSLKVDQKTGDYSSIVVTEEKAKTLLGTLGLNTPNSIVVDTKEELTHKVNELNSLLTYPLVLKGIGLAHKTEAGAVIVGIKNEQELTIAIANIPDSSGGYLLEEMAQDNVAELIIGVTRDQLGLYLLTIGAGGILAELLSDSISMLIPTSRKDVLKSLRDLKIYKILDGYRGKDKANIESIIDAVMTVNDFVLSCEPNETRVLQELDINPLIVGVDKSIAVDALIRFEEIKLI